MEQVKKQLNDLLPDLNEQNIVGPASTYIARKIFKGLGKLFEGAHDIQYWFGDCANRITNSISPAQLEQISAGKINKQTGKVDERIKRDLGLAERKALDASDFRSTVVWTTPLKLPVVQPYRISRAQTIKTHMATIILSEPNVTDSIDKRKQLQGFPPNFIHSLDATHMMLSALKAHEQGLAFSAVHDSFWTHAADIDSLNQLLREAFIRMHSEDIVGRLAAEFKMRYKGHLYLAKIGKHTQLAKRILAYRASIKKKEFDPANSTKKGKHNLIEKKRQYYELKQEHQRQKLLASEDPEERAKGEKMVTAASIFEDNDGEKHLKTKMSLGETALGNVEATQTSPENSVMDEALQHDDVPEEHDVDLASTLEPLVDASAPGGEINASLLGTETSKRGKAKGDGDAGASVWLWLPLTFKDVPKKGDWDVRRLRDSVYFFS